MFWLGKKFSEEHKHKLRLAKLGRTLTEEHKRKCGEALKGLTAGEKHYNWKGDNVGYRGLHKWVKSRLPKPKSCSNCGQEKKWLDLANITGVYTREFRNWKYLCRSCHLIYDYSTGETKPIHKNTIPTSD